MTNQTHPIIDIHSHVYLPSMMAIMRTRTNVPFISTFANQERLVILPNEELGSTSKGRPIGDEYWSIPRKLEFMDLHKITHSIISSANPWLDFLTSQEQRDAAILLNDELSLISTNSGERLFGFGVLPLGSVDDAISEVERIKKMPGLKGVIMGTGGCGNGLDDPSMLPLWKTIDKAGIVVFIHPHYGIGDDVFGSTNNPGHVLPLALGFTFETTIAVTKLVLSGIFDTLPSLKLLLAHSGGTLPFLAGRLDSCVSHDPKMLNKLAHPPSYYLKKLYYDAVCYNESSLKCLLNFVPLENVMFGTDNPFFPPLLDPSESGGIHSKEWESVTENYKSMEYLTQEEREAICWRNAERLFGLQLKQ